MGFRAHSGWAVLVAIRGSIANPSVVHRRRIELADRGIPGSAQPYHAAKRMSLLEAELFLRRCADSAAVMARDAVKDAVSELAERSCEVAGSCILSASGRTTTELAAILASHPMMHTAEGEFFRAALRSGCESCGLAISTVKEREVVSRSAAALGIATEEVERRAVVLGKSIGPPWRQDEKLAAMAGWLVLGSGET